MVRHRLRLGRFGLRRLVLACGGFLVAFVLGSLLVLPLWDRRSGLDVLFSGSDDGSMLLGDEPSPVPEPGGPSFILKDTHQIDGSKYYVADNGDIIPINLSIVPYGLDGYDYAMTQSWYSFYMKSNCGYGDSFKFSHNGTSFIYQPSDFSYRNEYGSQDYLSSLINRVGVVNNSEYSSSYSDVYPDVDFKYMLGTNNVKEYYIINSLPRSPQGWLTGTISLDFGGYVKYGDAGVWVDGVNMTGLDFVTNKSITFSNEQNASLFYLPDPVAWDSNNNVVNCSYEIKHQSG